MKGLLLAVVVGCAVTFHAYSVMSPAAERLEAASSTTAARGTMPSRTLRKNPQESTLISTKTIGTMIGSSPWSNRPTSAFTWGVPAITTCMPLTYIHAIPI